MKKTTLELIEEMLEVAAGTLDGGMELSEIEEWDSLAALSFMALAKKEFNKMIPTENIKKFSTVNDLIKALEDSDS